jgi:oligopeptide/dipeptide ABC transporter ATP-binding protein
MDVLFSAVDLGKSFKLRRRTIALGKNKFVRAVDGISFDVNAGETFGVVGESGCGKTTLARLIMLLEKPTSGQLRFKGTDLTVLNRKEIKKMRQKVQMIFQDPYSSLNPVKSIFYLVAEPIKVHKVYRDDSEIIDKVRSALDIVGLPSSDEMLGKRPDELSGGERQRVGIARALILEPEFIVADEPVSMLDASVRAEIISIMQSAKEQRNLTYIFITHEIDVAYSICDRIAVMYAGKIVELGSTEAIINNPTHPYTRLLIDAVPPIHPDEDESWGQSIGEGECAYYIEVPAGCKFQDRCDNIQDLCKREEPVLSEVEPGHCVACHMQIQ